MKQLVTIFALFWATVSFGQNSNEIKNSINPYDTLQEVTLIDNENFDIPGAYFISNGFTGYTLTLDNNKKYKKTGFSCYGRENVDSGRWTLQYGNIILFQSDSTSAEFDIIKYNNCYFLILQVQRQKFIKDFIEAREKLKNFRLTMDDKTYTLNEMLATWLSQNYYTKVNDFAGT